MSKRYKHIKIPTQLIQAESNHTPHTGRDIYDFKGFDFTKQKESLSKGISSIERFYTRKNKIVVTQEDRNSSELKIKFHGNYSQKFIDKYRIEIYKKEADIKNNSIVYGKIKNSKPAGQDKSDFERLKEDILNYKGSDQLRSYFNKVKEVKPLTLDQIIEKSLKKELKENPSKEIVVDVSFAKNEDLASKINLLEEQYQEKLISKINTSLVHFCRVQANYEDVKLTVNRCDGIVDIERGPIYNLNLSRLSEIASTVNITSVKKGLNPVFMFDGTINPNHFTIKDAVLESRSSKDDSVDHGTAVASLIVCGSKINPAGGYSQDNTLIAINYFDLPGRELEMLIKTIEEFSTKYPLLIVNLSINQYSHIPYLRKSIDNFTVALDELAHKHNCLFFISVGNFCNGYYWDQIKSHCVPEGYPKFFDLNYASILPPSDSINNISVGSVAYQESVNSVAKIKEPTPTTRANIKRNVFIKPDLVHFDSNLDKNLSVEYNGTYMASDIDGDIVRWCGTSFATPLVTHDAGVLHNHYPNYTANTIKALLVHFADSVGEVGIKNKKTRERLVGFGVPNIEKALYSISNSACLIIEDTIGINKRKKIRFPIPSSISGDKSKRLKISKTLVYNPLVNPTDVRKYNPINISVNLVREDEKTVGRVYTKNIYDGAHRKSNVKKYPAQDFSTKKHTGCFWYLDVVCESRVDNIPLSYKQNYSVVLSLEDIKKDENVNLHEDIFNMIEIETQIEIPLEIVP